MGLHPPCRVPVKGCIRTQIVLTIIHNVDFQILTLAPNSTRLARFWTDLATSVSVLTAVVDGGSEILKQSKVKSIQ